MPDQKLVPASSLASARPGEVLFVDRQGRVRQPPARATVYAISTTIGGVLGAAVVLTKSVLVGVVPVVALWVWVLRRERWARPLRTACRLLASRRHDEAAAAFTALEGRRLPAKVRAMLDVRVGILAWRRGALDEAAARLDRAAAVLGPDPIDGRHARFARAELAAVAGDLDRARRMQAELAGGPTTELWELHRQSLALVVAFHADDPSLLPDDDALYEWAKAALGRSRFGAMLVSLAWAFGRRGHDDMARHLLDEAPARLDGDDLELFYPKLGAWYARHPATATSAASP